jgi:PAS domain S-box-containing protein
VRSPILSGLRFRLSLLILAAVIPAVFLNLYSTLQQQRWVTLEVQQNALQISRAIAENQAQVTGGVEEMLSALAMLPAVQTMDPERCPARLAGFMKRYPHYTSLSVIDRDGHLVCRGLRPGETRRVEGLAVETAFRAALATGGFAVGDYAVGTITEKPVVPFALPITGPDGKVSAVLTTTMDLLWLSRYAEDADLPHGSTVSIIGGDGVVLGEYPPVGIDASPIPPPTGWLLSEIRNGRHEGVLDEVGRDGSHRLSAFSILPSPASSPVAVMVGIPRAEAFASADRMLAWNLLLLVLFGAAAVLAGWTVGTRVLLQPIRSAVGATRRLAAGRLDARAMVSPHGGELAELAVSFNDMAATLEQRTSETSETLAALRRSEERYRSLVESTASIVWDTPASGEFSTPQPRWADFTGQPFEEHRKWGWLQAVHPDDRGRVAVAWAAAVDDRAQFQAELRVRRHDGEYRHMMARATPILTDDGRAREWVGVYTDITDRKRIEEERTALLTREQELRAEAERSNRAKSDFLAIVSHELRTPLTSIISFAELLATDVSGELSDRHREFVARIDSSAWHLKGLVDQILEFTRLETGRVSVDPSDTDMPALVRDVVADLAPIADAKSLALHAEMPAEPIMLHTDPTKVRQILLNLVSNAVKFCDEGSVRVRMDAHDGEVTVRVRDSGPGIAAEHLDAIWESFRQLENPLTRRAGGTGLGLPIARRLSHLLGGRLEVSSELGAGSTFVLTLSALAYRQNGTGSVGSATASKPAARDN